MNNNRRSIQGMTMLEVMLTLAVGITFILMGLRLYNVLYSGSEIATVQSNVDMIFQAAANYYKANCRPDVDPNPTPAEITAGTVITPRALSPTDSYSVNPVMPVTIDTLIADGFLNKKPTPTSIVGNALPPNYGYIVQFNEVLPLPPKMRVTNTNPLTTIQVGQIVMWRIQVAVQLGNQVTTKIKSYAKDLVADCLSVAAGTTPASVVPCSTVPPPAQGAFAVWERLPSFAVPSSNSDLWMSNANVESFTDMYATRSSSVSASQNPSNGADTLHPYYYCGS